MGFSLASEGCFLVAVCGLLIVVASLVEHGHGHVRFSGGGSWALEHRLSSYGARA